jgi:hypothetical protein
MLTLFVPILLFLIYKIKTLRIKLIAIGILVGIGAILTQASFTIALILYALAIFLSIMFMKSIRAGLVVAVLSALIFLVVPWTNVFEFLANNINNRYISIRLNELSMFFASGRFVGDLAGRWRLYSRSLETFLNHPFGIGPYYKNIIIEGNIGVGYHSQIFDDLARFGIFAIPIHLAFFVSYYKFLKNQWAKVGATSIALIVVILYAVILLLNLGTTSIYEGVMLFIILPIIPEMIPLNKSKEVSVS